MKQFVAILCLVSSLMLFGSRLTTGQEKVKNPDAVRITAERDLLRGTWAVIGYEEDGNVHMYGGTASYWKFAEWEAREWLVNAGSSTLFPLWRSDPTSKPRKLDLVYVHEVNHEILIRQGVYDIDGDTLSWTLPQGFGGNPKRPTIDPTSRILLSARPTKLATARGDGFSRLIMKRVKNEAEAMTPEERKAKMQAAKNRE